MQNEILYENCEEIQVLNALAATAAAHHAGVDPSIAAKALSHFVGSKDRLTNLGSTNSGVSVWMDYAYHPAAIHATLKALRSRLGSRSRIVAGIPAHNQLKWDSYYRDGLIQAISPLNHAIIFAQPKTQKFAAFEGRIEEIPEFTQISVQTSRDYDEYRDLLSKQALPDTNIILFWTYTSGREFAEKFLSNLKANDVYENENLQATKE
ncbi:unnamed protein product, partial [Mesorhabditis belari]|uniref:Uncharacterized protein n=1 Tax=Mesorhabditis belari TaxID=2138241 RepID=A0AAF3FCA7_9BILA